MDRCDAPNKKAEIMDITWKYLLEKGLSKASVGDLCRETKISQSSLYYWFENKDDIWICAGKYGLSKVVEAMFAYTINHTNEIDKYFDTLLDEAEKYKYDLRLAVQLTTSPGFGAQMRDKSMEFNALYEKFGMKLMEISGCSVQHVEIFIYSIIAYVIDYAIWDDREKTQMLLDNLRNRTLRKTESEK